MSTQSQWIQLFRDRKAIDPVRVPDDAQQRLAALSGIRAVVFDVYGTLISSGVGDISLASEQDRDQSIKATFIEQGFQLGPSAQDVAFDEFLYAAIKAAQAERKAEGVTYPEVDIRKVWATTRHNLEEAGHISGGSDCDIDTLAIDYESRVNPTQAMPGLQETLSALQERRLAMSIISNAQFYTPYLFNAFAGNSLPTLGFSMDCSVWSYQQLEGKPSTRLYEIAAEQLLTHLGIQAHEALYVGNDQRNDIWPAQQIGFKTALFAGDHRSLRRRKDDPNYADILADLEITDLRQILDCI